MALWHKMKDKSISPKIFKSMTIFYKILEEGVKPNLPINQKDLPQNSVFCKAVRVRARHISTMQVSEEIKLLRIKEIRVEQTKETTARTF